MSNHNEDELAYEDILDDRLEGGVVEDLEHGVLGVETSAADSHSDSQGGAGHDDLESIEFTTGAESHLNIDPTIPFEVSLEDHSGSTDRVTSDVEEREGDDDEFGCLKFVETPIPVLNVTSGEEVEAERRGSANVSIDGVTEENEEKGAAANPSTADLSNPFGSDEKEVTPAVTGNDSSTSNPFGDDQDDHDVAPRAATYAFSSSPVRVDTPSKPTGEPFNPFDDGDIEGEEVAEKEKALTRRKVVTESLAPFTLASMLSKPTKSPPYQGEVPCKTYSKEYLELMTLGFDKVCVDNVLQKTSGDSAVARKMLISRLFNDHILTNDEVYVWKSPVMVRVGGWLPNVQDEAGTSHTSFFINVTMTLGNESWRIGHRYSEFYKLYSSVYNQMYKSFPSGVMKNPFPSDRLFNWLSLTNQETINDTRRKALDGWLRELINSPGVMLDDPTRKIIFSFFQVDENMAKVKKPNPTLEGKRDFVSPNRMIPAPGVPKQFNSPQGTTPHKAAAKPASFSPDAGRSSSGTSCVSADSEDSSAFEKRRKSAIAAQNNDYNSPLSPLKKAEEMSRNVSRNSEPSSSGFTDAPSASFAKRLNKNNN